MRIVQITTDSREHFQDYTCSKPSFGTAPQALLEGFEELQDAEIHVISCARVPTSSPEKLAENIWFHQPVVKNWGWGKSLYSGCVTAIRALVSRIDPDIVHGQGTERECALAAAYSGYPNVITIHGNMKELRRLNVLKEPYGSLASILETHALGKTAGVFCNSGYTRSLVEGRARKYWEVPNPIRASFFTRKMTDRKKTDRPTLLNIGVISPRKRQLEILKLSERLFEKGYSQKVVFIGDLGCSEYGAEFSRQMEKAKRNGYAEYAGTMSETELVNAFDEASGCVHFPSEEAFGLVVAEALARGVAFFGSNLGGIKEIAQGIPGASLHDDFDSLEAGIANWLDSGSPAASSAAGAMKERYSPSTIALRHIEIYREVLTKN